ncbi:MAG: hypothetical protein Q8M79_12470 [Dehalococcoidia bacterium]|nr:hypothetical protein [Dehalococcoidia bacterium]
MATPRGTIPRRHRAWRPKRSQFPRGFRAWARVATRFTLVIMLLIVGDRIAAGLTSQGWRMDQGAVIVVRVLTALPTLRFPLEGFLLALEVDKWDWYWLDAGSRSKEYQALYQQWDKVLDLFALGVAAFVALRWRDRTMRTMALAAFLLRAGGVGAFLLTEERWLLVAFPNVFETLFLMYVVFQVIAPREPMLTGAGSAAAVFLAALLPKLAAEYYLHILERRPWDSLDLPIPDMLEPQVWLALVYLPAAVVVALLVRRGRRLAVQHGRDPGATV